MPIIGTRLRASISSRSCARGRGWARLAEAIASGRAHANSEADAYLDAIERWAAELRALAETLLARVVELAPTVADPSTHPAKPVLYKHARGKLEARDVASRCGSPEATIALAGTLGVIASPSRSSDVRRRSSDCLTNNA